MAEKKVQCPECSTVFSIDLPEAQPEDLKAVTIKDIEEILTRKATDTDHRHKTADEFLDCPECRLWFDKTALRYQVTEKEPEPAPTEQPEEEPAEKPAEQPAEGDEKPEEKEPEPVAAKPAFGSIFGPKKEVEHEQQE